MLPAPFSNLVAKLPNIFYYDDMRERAPVLVDMDGVLADFDAEILSRIRTRLPDLVLQETRPNFYISDDYPNHREAIRELSCEEGFFASLPLTPHAEISWERLQTLDFHPRICSSPIRSNPFSEAEKLAWLDQRLVPLFGPQIVDEAIITSDKYLHDGLALIDDRPYLAHEEKATWQHIIFDQPYNRDVDKPRLRGWFDPNLGSLLNEAEQRYRMLGHRAIEQT